MEDHMKQKILILAAVVVLIFIGLGIYDWQSNKGTVADAHPCVVDFTKTFVYENATATQATTAKDLLTQLLNQYKVTPDCPTMGISDYSITSIGKPTQVKKDFTIPVTFDILPQSETATLWNTSETHKDGTWIRGKQMTLGITNLSTTTTLQLYRLVLP